LFNNELQTFIAQRDNIIVTMKDFNKKNDIYVTNVKKCLRWKNIWEQKGKKCILIKLINIFLCKMKP